MTSAQTITVADVLIHICTLPRSIRDQANMCSFVSSLPRNNGTPATPDQINQANVLVSEATQ
jgi:hypothetical protein